VRDRLEAGLDAASMRGSRTLFTGALGTAVFCFLVALGARQVTSEGPARGMLTANLASITELDLVLAEHGEELKQAAHESDASTFELPGYPLPVLVTRDEVNSLSSEQLRALILARSAEIVYTDGLEVFDRTGNQSLDLLSGQGALRLVLGELNSDTHDTANVVALFFAAITASLTVLVVLANVGFIRLKALGVGLVLGSLPGLMLFGLLWFVASQLGSDDPFESDLGRAATSMLQVFARDFAIVGLLGGLVVVASPLFAWCERRWEGSGEKAAEDGAAEEAQAEGAPAETSTPA
jgi:hypothetical protein